MALSGETWGVHCELKSQIYYHQTSKISHTNSKNINVAVVFAQSIEVRCSAENEDVVRAAPTGNAPTTSERSTILLPKVHLILEV